MWFRGKKPEQVKVVLNRTHIGRKLSAVPKRPLTEEEMVWVRESLSSRKELLDFAVPQLFAVSKCPCRTCRTVGLEPIALPGWNGRSGHIGESRLILRITDRLMSCFTRMMGGWWKWK